MKFNPAKITNKKQAQGYYYPKNPQKCGSKVIIYRSSWEKDFAVICDMNPSVLYYASEPCSIPYISPLDGKVHQYFPDFVVQYIDVDGKEHVEMVEIKPAKQFYMNLARTKKDKMTVLINQAKAAAATEMCRQNGMTFRVLTEHELYGKKK